MKTRDIRRGAEEAEDGRDTESTRHIAEVGALFERYEQALIDRDVDVLDATFWDSPTRSATPRERMATALPKSTPIASAEKRIRLEILTLGHDIATVNLEFKVRGQDVIGRQSQTWVHFPDVV